MSLLSQRTRSLTFCTCFFPRVRQLNGEGEREGWIALPVGEGWPASAGSYQESHTCCLEVPGCHTEAGHQVHSHTMAGTDSHTEAESDSHTGVCDESHSHTEAGAESDSHTEAGLAGSHTVAGSAGCRDSSSHTCLGTLGGRAGSS